MQVHELVARFAKAGVSSNPMKAAREELEVLRGDIDAVDQALRFISGTGGNARQVFYRSPSLSLLKATLRKQFTKFICLISQATARGLAILKVLG